MGDYIDREAALDIDVDVEVENEGDIDLIMQGMRIVIDHIKALPGVDIRPPNPATNGDKVRQMTDRELAMIVGCQNHKTGDDCFDASCFDCTLEWLQQEVKHE